MNIIAVDDEIFALKEIERAIKAAVKNAELSCFSSSEQAIDYAKKNIIDIAFLDIEMPEQNGLILAKRLKDIHGATNIIFVTGHNQYTGNAFNIHASGYILKPFLPFQVLEELEHLRYPVQMPLEHVRIQCFGSFGVFVNGEPLLFTRAKAKELLAYLVHKRGAASTTAEISAILWEECANARSQQSRTRTTISDLMKILKNAGVEDIIKKEWNSIAIQTEKVACDMYLFLEGNTAALNSYHGEYMNEYSWAEFSVGNFE